MSMSEIFVYGKPKCPNCDKAKNILESRCVEYTYVDVTVDQEAYSRLVASGFRSVPQIYLGDVHVGDHMAANTVGGV